MCYNHFNRGLNRPRLKQPVKKYSELDVYTVKSSNSHINVYTVITIKDAHGYNPISCFNFAVNNVAVY